MFSLLRWTWNREGSFSESKYIHHRHCLLLLLNPSIKPMALFSKGHHPGNNRCNLKTKWNKTTQSVTPKDVFQVICCHQMSLSLWSRVIANSTWTQNISKCKKYELKTWNKTSLIVLVWERIREVVSWLLNDEVKTVSFEVTLWQKQKRNCLYSKRST